MNALEYRSRALPPTARCGGTTAGGKHHIILGDTYSLFATVDELVELATQIIDCIIVIRDAMAADEAVPQ
jgi:hypothetical protein